MNKFLYALVILLASNLLAQTEIDSTDIFTFTYSGNKYEIIKQTFNWEAVAQIANERGGILAEINSQEEQDTIFHYLQNCDIDISKTISTGGGGASYVWIGGTDIKEEGKWFWDGNFDGIGKQFWEGTKTGNSVNGLYNNWGNEPDNVGNQDAIGLAISNWPYGIAGQWNDLQKQDLLYSVIEYDNSTFMNLSNEFLYKTNLLKFNVDFKFPFDSVQVIIDENVNETFFNVPIGVVTIESNYYTDKIKMSNAYLIAYSESLISYSNPFIFDAYSFTNPIKYYSTDFEDIIEDDFISQDFVIIKSGGFRNNAIHSPHNYENNADYKITFTKPIVIDSNNSQISYVDVAIVEPGDSGSVFGENKFKDYVVLEGLKNNEVWQPLHNGYDANQYSDWLTAWNATTLYRNLYKRQNVELTNTFEIGDTILIRFRLHSDDAISGWGWTIDSLQIQDFQVSVKNDVSIISQFSLEQNYPNPFNPSTVIKYSIPNAGKSEMSNVKLVVYDILGSEVATLVNDKQVAGNYEVKFDASNLSSGVYIYQLQSGGVLKSRKMLLLK
ncbi:MAG: T9SS type A sorting domain-containing protein [Bacteroidetes bacterium]|nr:T9SS type A sorting domain-containing protein [Bacteroidota bacterium]MBU1116415.1 T9SS type A sorting domain-containing protein [Bacteroidota bacterium]MBU1799994.1 T9SS type A sorting domain-containing protein [Bacteroidota bacterium]